MAITLMVKLWQNCCSKNREKYTKKFWISENKTLYTPLIVRLEVSGVFKLKYFSTPLEIETNLYNCPNVQVSTRPAAEKRFDRLLRSVLLDREPVPIRAVDVSFCLLPNSSMTATNVVASGVHHREVSDIDT